jgi:hypothetical protein
MHSGRASLHNLLMNQVSKKHPSRDLCDGYVERRVAVQDGNPDLQLSELTIEVFAMRRRIGSSMQHNVVSMRRWRWFPLYHRHRARPSYLQARSASFLAWIRQYRFSMNEHSCRAG